MAIVTKTAPSAPKWEEFVTIKLSKREAAGVLALLGAATGELCGYKLYKDLDEALNANNFGSVGVSTEGTLDKTMALNTTYGPLL